MMAGGAKVSGLLKIGVVLFCFMCLFFATYMTSKYEHQKTETEIQASKVKELEEKIHELFTTNQELLHIRSALVQEKEQLAKEINTLREKQIESEGWKHALEQEPLTSDLATNQQSMADIKKRLPEGNEPNTPSSQPLIIEKEDSTLTKHDTITSGKWLEESQEVPTGK
jgi:septal ring factor EnvC (AmiA/AmiB activator)